MHPKRQREIALAIAAMLLIAVTVWTVRRSTTPPAAAAPGGATASSTQPQSKHPIASIDLEALDAKRPEPEESDRNPFRFKPKPASPPPAAASDNNRSRPPPLLRQRPGRPSHRRRRGFR